MNNKIKKIGIIVILFFIIILYLMFINSNMLLRKYDTLEKALKANSINPESVIGILEQENVKLITYMGISGTENIFFYLDINNKYYTYRTSMGIPAFRITFKKHQILVMERDANMIIYVSSSFLSEDSIVCDSINSEFSYCKINFYDAFLRKWLLVLDQLPEDYKIIIDGESIDINI